VLREHTGAEERRLGLQVVGVLLGGVVEQAESAVVLMQADQERGFGVGEWKRGGLELERLVEGGDGGVWVVEGFIRFGEDEGQRLDARGGLEEADDGGVVLAGEQGTGPAFESQLGVGIEAESFLPLVVGLGELVGLVVERSKKQMRLEDFRLQTGCRFQFGDGFSCPVRFGQGEAVKVVELGGLGIGGEAGAKGFNGAGELAVTGKKAAELDGGLRGGVGAELSCQCWRSGAAGGDARQAASRTACVALLLRMFRTQMNAGND